VNVLGTLDLGQSEAGDELAPLSRPGAIGLGLHLAGRGDA
jgi:hypothetical protein